MRLERCARSLLFNRRRRAGGGKVAEHERRERGARHRFPLSRADANANRNRDPFPHVAPPEINSTQRRFNKQTWPVQSLETRHPLICSEDE